MRVFAKTLLGALLGALPAPLVALEEITDFGSNPGQLQMFLQRPSETLDEMPLVVALHGCTMSADRFDNETGLAALAEELGFVLLLPQQSDDNQPRKCFRWYDEDHNRPGLGESASILQMIDHALAHEAIDPDRVEIMGLSAGGAMTAVMLANYPSRFDGGAIIAGLPFDCNRPRGTFDGWWSVLRGLRWSSLFDGADAAYACGVKSGLAPVDRDPADWARYITDIAQDVPETWPRLSIWQGAADETVEPQNLRELVDQWTALQPDLVQIPETDETVSGATRKVWRLHSGEPRLETWELPDLPHAVPVNAQATPACGIAEADYMSNGTICAVRRIVDFWGLLP
ncbi:PHB depolymerase family esterase [Citreicella sp. C3M06]|uniref:extracellular catalytic domain type 1 short-chain-length polyhydroxyalkanoate depolymerase n=1 Tax=Citreicella sp. C3M06 TaxID=2841564 RepID=UPI001C087903|nr:PHB depolymerase family esterase [Citreicella sp. C3M06]MBU2962357.1 PHB depolymerase family esterase [Citreicella sp. C3M06]